MKNTKYHVVFMESHEPENTTVYPVNQIICEDGKYKVILDDGTILAGTHIRYATDKEVIANHRITPTSVGYSNNIANS